MTIPPPESWETAVPPYGIRAPKPSAPALKLPTALQRMGEDVSTALADFGLPPVISGHEVVAGSQSARDAHWGVPTTAAQRLALHALGATTIRTDKGWAERYYCALTDGGATPGGARVPGWYPVAGEMPGGAVRLKTGASSAIPANSYTFLTDSTKWQDYIPAHEVSAFNGTWVIPFDGVWEVSSSLALDGTLTAFQALKVNSTTANATASAMASSSAGAAGLTLLTGSARARFAAGDVLRLAVFSTAATSPQTVVGYEALSVLGIRFIEPARS